MNKYLSTAYVPKLEPPKGGQHKSP